MSALLRLNRYARNTALRCTPNNVVRCLRTVSPQSQLTTAKLSTFPSCGEIRSMIELRQAKRPPQEKLKRNLKLLAVGALSVTVLTIYELNSPKLFPDEKKDIPQIVKELKRLLFNSALPENFRADSFCKRLTAIQNREKRDKVLQSIFCDPDFRMQLAEFIVRLDSTYEKFNPAERMFKPLYEIIEGNFKYRSSFSNEKPLMSPDCIQFFQALTKNVAYHNFVGDEVGYFREWILLPYSFLRENTSVFLEEQISSGILDALYAQENFHSNFNGGVQINMILLVNPTGINFLRNKIAKHVQEDSKLPYCFNVSLMKALARLNNPVKVIEQIFSNEFIRHKHFFDFCNRFGAMDIINLLVRSNTYEIPKAHPNSISAFLSKMSFSKESERKMKWILAFPEESMHNLLRQLPLNEVIEISQQAKDCGNYEFLKVFVNIYMKPRTSGHVSAIFNVAKIPETFQKEFLHGKAKIAIKALNDDMGDTLLSNFLFVFYNFHREMQHCMAQDLVDEVRSLQPACQNKLFTKVIKCAADTQRPESLAMVIFLLNESEKNTMIDIINQDLRLRKQILSFNNYHWLPLIEDLQVPSKLDQIKEFFAKIQK